LRNLFPPMPPPGEITTQSQLDDWLRSNFPIQQVCHHADNYFDTRGVTVKIEEILEQGDFSGCTRALLQLSMSPYIIPLTYEGGGWGARSSNRQLRPLVALMDGVIQTMERGLPDLQIGVWIDMWLYGIAPTPNKRPAASPPPKRTNTGQAQAEEKARQIIRERRPYFEQQSERRCLEQAFNNVWKRKVFELPPHAARVGSDWEQIKEVKAPDGAPMYRLQLDAAQVKAFMEPLLAATHVIVYEGRNPTAADDQGHYVSVGYIENVRVLFDSKEKTVQWLPDPEQFYAKRAFPLSIAVADGESAQTPRNLQAYDEIAKQYALDQVWPVLAEVTGRPALRELTERLLEWPPQQRPQSLVMLVSEYVDSTGGRSQGWMADQQNPVAALNIDRYLDNHVATYGCAPRLLLCTGTRPTLLAAWRDESGRWQARAPSADGIMVNEPLATVLARQGDELDQAWATAGAFQNEDEGQERQAEIDRQRRQLAIVALDAWPNDWPPREMGARNTIARVQAAHATEEFGDAFDRWPKKGARDGTIWKYREYLHQLCVWAELAGCGDPIDELANGRAYGIQPEGYGALINVWHLEGMDGFAVLRKAPAGKAARVLVAKEMQNAIMRSAGRKVGAQQREDAQSDDYSILAAKANWAAVQSHFEFDRQAIQNRGVPLSGAMYLQALDAACRESVNWYNHHTNQWITVFPSVKAHERGSALNVWRLYVEKTGYLYLDCVPSDATPEEQSTREAAMMRAVRLSYGKQQTASRLDAVRVKAIWRFYSTSWAAALAAYEQAIDIPCAGSTFVRALYGLCMAQAPYWTSADGKARAYAVTPAGAPAPLYLMCYDDGTFATLQPAAATLNDDAFADVLQRQADDIESDPKLLMARSANSADEYTTEAARRDWHACGKDVTLQAAYTDWLSSFSDAKTRGRSGAIFLQAVNALCKAESGEAIDDLGLLRSHKVELENNGVTIPVEVWRWADSNGYICQRGTPSADEQETRHQEMRNAAAQSASKKFDRATAGGTTPFEVGQARDEWAKAEKGLAGYLKQSNTARRTADTGALYLLHLSVRCDVAAEDGDERAAATQQDLTIYEYSINPIALPPAQGTVNPNADDAEKISVYRLATEELVQIRRVPDNVDAQEKLQKEMFAAAEKQRTKKQRTKKRRTK
jgi:hypothetical protein